MTRTDQAAQHHTSVSSTYVPSSLLECNELRPVSELESRSPEGSTDFRMDLAKDLAAAAASVAATAGEFEPSDNPLEFPAVVKFLETAPLCCWKSSGGSGGSSGVAMMRSRSLKRTLFSQFSELLEPLLLPEELPGLPVASLLAWN